MLRLFAGIAIPPSLRAKLQSLHAGIPGAHWVDPEKYHITLTFIGEVNAATAEDVDETLAHVRMNPFSLRLEGTGYFMRSGHPGHLWAGVAPSEELHRLKEKIDRALDARNLPFHKRKYTPHATIAKLKHVDEEKLAAFLADSGLFSTEAFKVTSFSLYRSHMGKNGSFYETINDYFL